MENGLFYYLLVFIGVRVKPKQNVYTDDTLLNRFKRRIISKNQEIKNRYRQPRKLTREVCKILHDRELSPPPSPISSPESSIAGTARLNVDMKKYKFTFSMVSWLYPLCILFFLLTSPSLIIWRILEGEEEQTFLLSNFFFNMIPPTQYILSLNYFSTNHFEDFFIKNKEHCFPNMNKFTIFIISATLILGFVNFLLVQRFIIFDKEETIPDLYTNNVILNVFISIFSWMYGGLIVYTNLVCFSLVFCKHCKIINEYVEKLDKDDNLDVLTINVISQDILKIRRKLEISIDHFKNIFSLFTLLGTIGLGFFFERIKLGNFQLFPWGQFIIYIIIQIVFTFVILKLSKNQEKLIDYVRKPNFVNKFLRRYTVRDVQKRFSGSTELLMLNLEEENASMMDWIILDRLLNEKWAEFSVMGIDVTDGSLIKRGITLVTLIVAFTAYVS